MEFAKNYSSKQEDYNPIADGNSKHNPYTKQIEQGIKTLQKFLLSYGRIMTNIDNGKDYIVFEITQLSGLMGKRYAICQLYKNEKPFGPVYSKPFILFKEKNR